MKVLKLVFIIIGVFCSLVPTGAQDRSHELVFTNGNIFKADVDSGVITQLTDTAVYETNPVWSPDGTQIAYTAAISSDYYGQYGLYVMNEDGSNVIRIADDLMWRSEAIWLRDGSALVYATSPVEGGDCMVKLVKRDGSDAREVLHKTSALCNVPNLNPVLSPDGTQLIVGFDEQGSGLNAQLYLLTLGSGELTQLTHNRATNAAPQWSADGAQITFVSNQEGLFQVYAMDANGGNQRQLTHRQGNNFGPYWLPDSSHIVFQSDLRGYNIFELDVNKGVVRNLTNLTESGAWSMVLSPDGSRIAYLTGEDPVAGADHINVMDLASGQVQVLSDDTNKAYSLGWYGLDWRPING